MDYHEFLRLIWRTANRPGKPISLDSFDRTLSAGLRRLNEPLWTAVTTQLGGFGNTPDVLRFLERHWQDTVRVSALTNPESEPCPSNSAPSNEPSKPSTT